MAAWEISFFLESKGIPLHSLLAHAKLPSGGGEAGAKVERFFTHYTLENLGILSKGGSQPILILSQVYTPHRHMLANASFSSLLVHTLPFFKCTPPNTFTNSV